jgi:hypothetical protein
VTKCSASARRVILENGIKRFVGFTMDDRGHLRNGGGAPSETGALLRTSPDAHSIPPVEPATQPSATESAAMPTVEASMPGRAA